MSNKELYPTFARTNAIHSQVAPSVIELMNYFGWKKVGIVCENNTIWKDTCTFLKKNMESKGVNTTLNTDAYVTSFEGMLDASNKSKIESKRVMNEVLQDIRENARSKYF